MRFSSRPSSEPPTFLFEDYETFGLDTTIDRPAQIGLIRTDMDLNVIGKPIMEYCQLTPDYVPHPGACVVTGITPRLCMEKGLPEHKFAALIAREKSVPNTISVGFNNIKYDGEITRFMLWRNLHPAYEHEWKNGCGRIDIMHMVHAAYAFNIPGIKWPKDAQGNVSFKLTALTEANGIPHVGAHDALSDCWATIAVARLIRQQSPALFDYCIGMRDKKTVKAMIDLQDRKPILQVTRHTSVEKGCVSVVMPMITNPNNANEVVVWDLSEDPSELLTLSAPEIRARMYVKTADLVEGTKRIPLRSIKVNASPILASIGKLSATAREKWKIDFPTIQENAAKCLEVMEKLGENNPIWHQIYERETRQIDVDQDLYGGGFMTPADRSKLDVIRKSTPAALGTMVETMTFDDPRLPELVFRYRARNFPDSLSSEESVRWAEHCAIRMTVEAPGRLTLNGMQEIITALQAEKDRGDQDMLEEVAQYGQAT